MAVTLGKSIQLLRQAKGLSQSKFAKEAGLSVPYVSLIESDKRQPSMPVIERMSNALGVPALFLIRKNLNADTRTSLGGETEEEIHIQSAIDKLIELENKLKTLVGGNPTDGSIQEDNG